MKSLMQRLSALAILGVLAVPASAALGQTTVPPINVRPNTVWVSYSDLDTGSRMGMDVLENRIDRAVVAVCRFHDRNSLMVAAEEFDCRHETRADAWSQFTRKEGLVLAQSERVIELAALTPLTY
jgi:UrcA family protein